MRDGTIYFLCLGHIYSASSLLFMADYSYEKLEIRIQDEDTFELLSVSIYFIDFSNQRCGSFPTLVSTVSSCLRVNYGGALPGRVSRLPN